MVRRLLAFPLAALAALLLMLTLDAGPAPAAEGGDPSISASADVVTCTVVLPSQLSDPAPGRIPCAAHFADALAEPEPAARWDLPVTVVRVHSDSLIPRPRIPQVTWTGEGGRPRRHLTRRSG